jgi:hypothetical protein
MIANGTANSYCSQVNTFADKPAGKKHKQQGQQFADVGEVK